MMWSEVLTKTSNVQEKYRTTGNYRPDFVILCTSRSGCWRPRGQHVIVKELWEWRFASWCYRFEVSRGWVRVGKGRFRVGQILVRRGITSRYIFCCRTRRLVLSYQRCADGLQKHRSNDLTSFSFPKQSLFNMQTHSLCQTQINSPPKTLGLSKQQRGAPDNSWWSLFWLQLNFVASFCLSLFFTRIKSATTYSWGSTVLTMLNQKGRLGNVTPLRWE